MLRLLEVRPGIGCSTWVGFGVDDRPARPPDRDPTARCWAWRSRPTWSASASANLAATAQPWATITRAAPDVLGLPDSAPYDRILVSAEPQALPQTARRPARRRRADGDPGRGTMLLVTRDDDRVEVTEHGGYRFVPLR